VAVLRLTRPPLGSRVGDALRAAGGALPGVDLSSLNLARKLVDGEQVLVGVVPPPGAVAGAPAGGGLVNLNSATAEQLESLPGVGPVLAQRIVDWRQTHGGFRSVEQLREVSGIGAAKYADLKSKVTV
jgi:competence protein ComEA